MCHSSIAHGIAVKTVSGYRMAEMGRVDADLVSAPGFDAEFHKRERVVLRKDGPMRNCRFAVAFRNGHAFRIKRFASDQGFERSSLRLRCAVENREICLADSSMRLKFPPQCEIRALRPRKHHHSACFAIQSVHHSRAFFASNSGHVREIFKQDVAERSVGVAGSAVHDHTGGFVDDNYVVISVDYFQGNVSSALHLLL